MKTAVVLTFVFVLITGGPEASAWDAWWWPAEYAEVFPQKPDPCDVVAITLRGKWPDSCIPNDSNSTVAGNDVYIDVIRDYPPEVGCNTVIMPWSQTEHVGPLAEGTYIVYAKLIGDPEVPETYTQVTGFRVKYCGESIVEDFNGDCFIDFIDFAELAEAWNSQPGDDNWNAECDISDPKDDFIDELDLRVLVDLWGADI